MFDTLARHAPPPVGVPSPSRSGEPAHLRALFGLHAAAIEASPRLSNFRYRSAADFVDVFRTR